MLIRLLETLLLYLALVPFGVWSYKIMFGASGGVLRVFLTGYFVFTTLCSLVGFFLPVDRTCFYILLGVSILLILTEPEVRKHFRGLNFSTFGVLLVVASVIGSFPVKIPDEASYYLQSIYALQEGGWIEGLANLEPRFALGSSFHVLGATGMISGEVPLKVNVLLWMLAVYNGLARMEKNGVTNAAFWFGLSLGALPLYFLLIPSQSPDLLGLVMFGVLLEHIVIDKSRSTFLPFILMGAAILLKPTIAFTAGVLVMLWLLMCHSHLKSARWHTLLFILPLIIWMGKNLVVSGYPFYPLQFLPLELRWTVPQEALATALTVLKQGHVSFFGRAEIANTRDWFQLVFFELGVKSYLMWLVALISIGLMVYSWRKREKMLLLLCLVFLLTLPVWIHLSSIPNFRLGMHLFIPTLAFLLARALSRTDFLGYNKRLRQGLLSFLLIIGMSLFLLPSMDFSSVIANPVYNRFEPLDPVNILMPKPTSYPEGYCGTSSFPCVSFDLYPRYHTSFDKNEGYYYLGEK